MARPNFNLEHNCKEFAYEFHKVQFIVILSDAKQRKRIATQKNLDIPPIPAQIQLVCLCYCVVLLALI
jgi:hypothetical protein